MKKEIGPGAIAAAVVILLVVLVFAGIKFFGKSNNTGGASSADKAAYEEYSKTGKHPAMTKENGPASTGK